MIAQACPWRTDLICWRFWPTMRTGQEKPGFADDAACQAKPQITLQPIKDARAAGVSRGSVLADAGCRAATAFRDELAGLRPEYRLGVQGDVSIWPPGEARGLPGPGAGGDATTPDQSLQAQCRSQAGIGDKIRVLAGACYEANATPAGRPITHLTSRFARVGRRPVQARPVARHAASGRVVDHRLAAGRQGAIQVVDFHAP